MSQNSYKTICKSPVLGLIGDIGPGLVDKRGNKDQVYIKWINVYVYTYIYDSTYAKRETSHLNRHCSGTKTNLGELY